MVTKAKKMVRNECRDFFCTRREKNGMIGEDKCFSLENSTTILARQERKTFGEIISCSKLTSVFLKKAYQTPEYSREKR